MLSQIKDYLKRHSFKYIPIPGKYIPNIHNLIFKKIVNQVPDGTVLLYYGVRNRITMNYDAMIRYYLLSIECGNTQAMDNLATHYENNNDYASAMKYYHMATNLGHTRAMQSLAQCYAKRNDHANAVKYYLMAIEHGNIHAICNLALYYYRRNDYSDAFKFWSLALEYDDDDTIAYALRACWKIMPYSHSVVYINKILNKLCRIPIIDIYYHIMPNTYDVAYETTDCSVNVPIMDVILHCVQHVVDADIINIIINMDIDSHQCNELFGKFKQLIDL